MSKRLFTQEQIALLLQNKNIARASEKTITYSRDFKLAAVKRYKEGLPPSDIFREAGFDLALIGRKTPKWQITKWRRIVDTKGTAALEKDGRGSHHKGGRPPNPRHMSEGERLKYLEAENAYLKAENAFLAKLRKQRLN
jgi:transposase-like protein